MDLVATAFETVYGALDVSRTVTEGYKVWFALAGLTLALSWKWLHARGLAKQFLIALTLLASANYARWGFESTFQRLDSYDLLHYYLNSKYFDELGYYDLYPAAILADKENDGFFQPVGDRYMAQNAEGHQIAPIEHALAHGKIVRDRFAPERWEQFEHDLLFFQREVRPGFPGNAALWREMIQDHGFNGTPAWMVLAEPIAQRVPVENIKALAFIDLVLLGAGVAMVVWAYGPITAWWVVFWLAISYSMRWPYVPWVFLRYDWVFALLATMALLKKRQHLLAGLFAGWAGTLRFFPALWMWGPFAKGVAGLAAKKVNKPLLVLAGGFLISAAVFEAAGAMRVGPDNVVVHFENMMDHNKPEQLSSRRIGLALAMTHPLSEKPPKLLSKERRHAIERQKPYRYAIGILIMVVMGAGMRRLRDDEAYGFGFIPFFLLTTASYYYYTARVTMALLHAADLSKTRNRVGLAMLMGMEAFSNWAAYDDAKQRMFLIGWLAIMLLGYTLTMTLWLFKESYVDAAPEEPVAAP